MSFLHPRRTGNARTGYYWITLVIVLAAYFIGSAPSTIAFLQSGRLSGDPVKVLQDAYGLNATFVLIVFPLVLTFFGVLAATKWLHRFPVISIFTARPKFDFKRLFVAFGLWMLAMGITFLVDWHDDIRWNFDASRFWVLLVLSLVLLPLQCMAEELFFRGVLLQWFGKSVSNQWVVVILTGTLFGLVHAANPEVAAIGWHALFYYIFSGIFLSAIVVIDDGLELTIGYHIANNLFVALIVTNEWQAFQTDALFLDTRPPAFTLVNMMVLMALQGLFFLTCAWVFKWKDRSADETKTAG